MTHMDYFNNKNKEEIEIELQRLCQLKYERNKEFDKANKTRNTIVLIGFAVLFFVLFCIIGQPTGINILRCAIIAIILSLFYYFINFSIFISWLASKGMDEHNRLAALDEDITYLEKLYDEKNSQGKFSTTAE